MKQFYYLFLFFYLNITAQNDSLSFIKSNISVVSADKLNVVYRGILNPISIAVPNCKSFNATGVGLNKIGDNKYNITPGQGLYTIIKVDIELNDGSKITEEHKFRIIQISFPMLSINNKSCSVGCIIEMTKEELFTAVLQYKFPDDFLFDLNIQNYKITNFIFNNNKKKIYVTGNKFNNEALNQIKKLKIGSIFSLTEAGYSFPGSENYMLPRLLPVKIMIVEKEVKEDYFKSKEFIRDSIQRIKRENKLLRK